MTKAHDHRSDDIGLSAVLAELASADTADLRCRWMTIFGREAPASLRSGMMARILAYQLQADQLGDVRMGVRHVRKSAAAAPQAEGQGIKLLRTWRGEVHEVETQGRHFLYRGRRYRSLTAIARDITGTHWNGLTFFGVKGRADLSRAVRPGAGR